MPLHHMPVLEVAPPNAPAFKLAQTTAIIRYVAKTHDLEADTSEEQAFCDMYAEQIQDYVYAIWVSGNWSKTFYGTKPVEEV
ncbi:hypothetical protein AAVH_11117 [Aphelenchoides avenae]|nr:hypothetical protein AAVH_11117 [Aphelenchus avenae]